MQNPTFSIIVINYNYARFLTDAVRSALAVEGIDKEVIVVDDGSTDDSAEVIGAFGHQVISVFKENGGALSCVNTGFERSRGDIIIFLDADDRIRCDVAKFVLSVWEPQTAKVQYLANVIDASGAPVGRVQPTITKLITQSDIRRSLVSTSNYVASACSANAYARWYLAQILPLPVSYTAHKNAPDDLLNPVAPLYGRVITVQVPLCDYRHHGANDSTPLAFNINNIRRMIARDQERLHFVREVADRRGLQISANALFRCPYHMLTCVVLKKYDPRLCPYQHSLWRLTALALSATVRYRCIGARQKLALIAWLLCFSVASEAIAHRLIAFRYVPGSRPAWASVLLSWLRIKGDGAGSHPHH